jgi:hypothetical protein
VSRPVFKLVGERWRPRMLVLQTNDDGDGGLLWWYSEAEGIDRPKGSLPLEQVRVQMKGRTRGQSRQGSRNLYKSSLAE